MNTTRRRLVYGHPSITDRQRGAIRPATAYIRPPRVYILLHDKQNKKGRYAAGGGTGEDDGESSFTADRQDKFIIGVFYLHVDAIRAAGEYVRDELGVVEDKNLIHEDDNHGGDGSRPPFSYIDWTDSRGWDSQTFDAANCVDWVHIEEHSVA
jgi:hypothetical protein